MSQATGSAADQANRLPITFSVMIATIMISIDTTIANVAVPHIQGSLSAAPDQITWVLTSYIVASAICTPLTGWLTGRLGRKRLFLVAIFGFTVASMLCGIAETLPQIVLFRLLQGASGAVVVPLSQALLLDIYPPEKHGQAMAMWGAGALLGPILGPALGGYLTDHASWRWCFYINLPIGIIAALGLALFISGEGKTAPRRFDFMGFGFLALALGSFQLMLDRGPGEDWFNSKEIWTEAIVAMIGFWVFLVHTLTAKNSFFDRNLAKNRNFMIGSLFGFLMGIVLFASMALLAPMLQVLMGYSVLTSGLVMVPRGIGSFTAMIIVGRLVGKIDARLILLVALMLTGFAAWQMTHFDLSMGPSAVIVSGIIQGFGLGLVFVPMVTLTFSTLPPALRADGSSFYALIRNLGASVGISIMEALITQNSQVMHDSLASKVVTSDVMVRDMLPAAMNPATVGGATALNAEITRQAMMVAYVDDFKLMVIITLICIPLAFVLRQPRRNPGEGVVHVAVE